MKYKAIIETDDFENFKFFEDGNGKYIHGIDAGAVNDEWIVLYFTEYQEHLLDKIRADVINIADGRQSISVRSVIKIIDKYKTESK